ncbi:hypothetical protein CHI95_13240 [Providencia rettgeri]|uniref:Uncharacterized protein n=1 Tax=Providencia rettgeri TaxID=587 RepID=A0A264VRX4_PRORE|nr:hypothetical protein [Providencia rettgeri]OZS74053.1 hypothetical protein CHI95_13240 [Providencia rettgeri]
MYGYKPLKQHQEHLDSEKRRQLMNFINNVDNLIIQDGLKLNEILRLRCFGIVIAKHKSLDEMTLTKIEVNLPPKKP